jgi:hypothetical protein
MSRDRKLALLLAPFYRIAPHAHPRLPEPRHNPSHQAIREVCLASSLGRRKAQTGSFTNCFG